MNLAVADQPWRQAGGTYELWLTVTDIAGEWSTVTCSSSCFAVAYKPVRLTHCVVY
jgi:hypothetical protein